jgi:hypothetical protein
MRHLTHEGAVLRDPRETKAAATGMVLSRTTADGLETWWCWPDRLQTFVLVYRHASDELVTRVESGRWLRVRDAAKWTS